MDGKANNTDTPRDQRLAVIAESLFLINLLLLPGIGFLGLAYLFFKHRNDTSTLALCHLHQTFMASLFGGVLLVMVNLWILWLGGFHSSTTWLILILYFTIVHSSLVMLGIVGLSRAMGGRTFHFPLIGRLDY